FECGDRLHAAGDAGRTARIDDDGRRNRAVKIQTPHVDWLTLSPELSLLAAGAVCLLVAVLTPGTWRRPVGAFFAFAGFITAGIFAGVVYDRSAQAALEVGNAITRDRLGAFGAIVVCGSGLVAVFISYSHRLRQEYVAE